MKNIGIKDNHMNGIKKFVRAELLPPNNNKMIDVKKWRYRVDHDIIPDWYKNDTERYEQDFRNAVEEYMTEWKKQSKFICGYYWTSIQNGDRTYYFMNGILKNSEFGKTNYYKKSYVQKNLIKSELAAKLKKNLVINLFLFLLI